MLKIRVTAAVFGACYVHCQSCAHAMQLQTRSSASRSLRRGCATGRGYLNDGHLVSRDPAHIDVIGSSSTRFRERKAMGGRQPNSALAAPSSELLTFDEEKEIAAEIRQLRSVTKARDHLSDWLSHEFHPHGELFEHQWASSCALSVDELREVLARGQEARTRLVKGNVGLVTSITKRYHLRVRGGTGRQQSAGGSGTGHEATLKLDDLIQEGNLGIMEAAERYDPTRGFRFSTYATHWIRQRIVRAIAEGSRTIRLPVHVQTMVRNMRKKNRELKAQIGRLPSLPELAHEMGVPLDKVRRYQHATRNILSLELPVDRHADDKRTLGDRVASDDMATPEEDLTSEALRGEVHAMLGVLGSDERGVLTHRFGLEARAPKTLQKTAEVMGVSIDKVRSTEARALNKLRRPQTHYRLREYVVGTAEACGIDAAHVAPQPLQYHMAAEHVGAPHYPHSTNVASWNTNDTARNHYVREYKRHTPESIWSF